MVKFRQIFAKFMIPIAFFEKFLSLMRVLLYVHSSIAIFLMGKRELVALLNLSSWCLVMVERLFLAVPRGCLRFVIVVFPDHTHLLFLKSTAWLDALANVNLHWYCLDCNHQRFFP